MSDFVSLGLKPWLIEQIAGLSISRPTPVQSACIPEILAGRDVVGCAETGSGKTLAFALPIMNRLLDDPVGPFALVVTPTRELAFQITDQLRVLCQALNFRLLTVTGGRDSVEQGRQLAGRPHFIIGTPGRLADHLENSADFKLDSIKFLILDEADRLLEDNFGRDLGKIVSSAPTNRQTLLFSATYTKAVQSALSAAAVNSSPFVFAPSQSSESDACRLPDTLQLQYCLMPAQVKDAFLLQIVSDFLSENPNSLVIVFTNKCKWCHLLGLIFKALGQETVMLHSALTQRQRLESLNKFKSNQVRVLISTDVGSRGLDIPLVDLVVSHNVPTRSKDFVHRCGRTARAGRSGRAIVLANQFELGLLKEVESLIGRSLPELKVKEAEVAKIVTDVVVARREAEIRLDELHFDEKRREHREKRRFVEAQRASESGGAKAKAKAKNKAKLSSRVEKSKKPPKRRKMKTD